MGVSSRAERDTIRKRMQMIKMNDIFDKKNGVEASPPTRDEIKCKACGFKARYKFYRCPECNAIQE